MSAVQIQGNASGTGTLTIAAPNTNTNRTLTLPDNTGTLLSTASTFAGTGPVLISGNATSVTVPTATSTTFLAYGASAVDTTSAFSITTGRFQPLVAGYYLVMGFVGFDSNGVNATAYSATIFKNGSTAQAYAGGGSTGSIFPKVEVTTLVSLNGSTDYVTLAAYQNGAGSATGVYGQLQAVLIRAA